MSDRSGVVGGKVEKVLEVELLLFVGEEREKCEVDGVGVGRTWVDRVRVVMVVVT